ncbi:MAG: tRNA (adenosine(37)-N6)-threonylcarbamoyltransferase complex dimerization subunit type 1 TsaB [Bacteroidia bacterium]
MSKKKNLNPASEGLAPARRILAIETATDVSSVALFEDGKLVGLQENHANRTHARLVTVMIERLLQDLEWTPRDLSAVCVAKGPGSYTGLRVGVSVAKGLCMALDIPLLSISSLEALAWSVRDVAQVMDARICPMIDARRMEVYTQTFAVSEGSGPHPENEPHALIVEAGSYAEELSKGKVLFLGDGAAKCAEVFANQGNAIFLGSRLSSAAHLGYAADLNLQAGKTEDLVLFEPFYLKEFVATLSSKKLV